MNRTFPLIENVANSYIAQSPIAGKGLFTRVDLSANDIIGFLDGQSIDAAVHPDALSGEWNGLGGNMILLRAFSTLYSFINHSKRPNLSVNAENMTIYCKDAIAADTELTLDYLEHGVPPGYLDLHSSSYLR